MERGLQVRDSVARSAHDANNADLNQSSADSNALGGRGRRAVGFRQTLADVAYSLYERFQPEIPEGKKGWGAKGELDLGLIQRLGK